MEKEYEIPKTVARLEQWMRDRNYHFSNYAIGGNSIYEGYGIDEMEEGFAWYFAERGQKNILKIFEKEADIVAHAFKEIQFDKWGNNYCIGFTESIDRASELCAILVRMKIVFTRDQIPYFGPKKPAFRVFVYGWDVLKTKELQAKYYEVKLGSYKKSKSLAKNTKVLCEHNNDRIERVNKEFEVPTSIAQLRKWMEDHHYHFWGYAVGGNEITEGCGIEKVGKKFVWYYIERGRKDILETFKKEEDVVAHAFKQIKDDKWASIYCIGFTEDKNRASELSELLTQMDVLFTQEEVPASGADRTVYKTFVYGSDILKTKELKAKYYEVK